MYYKVLAETGECYHGGSGAWPLPRKNGDGTWTPGVWLKVTGEIVPCANGLHACRDEQVLAWIGPAMFELAYDGEPRDANNKCVGRRARLLRRFEAWGERTARLFACDCAERVLPLFEREYPDDLRPRQAIDTARRYANGEADMAELDAAWAAAMAAVWDAAWAAVWGAERDAAMAAARAAASAAAWAAVWDAASAAAWAAAMAAVWGAERDAAMAAALYATRAAERDAAWDAERGWQYGRLCAYLEGKEG